MRRLEPSRELGHAHFVAAQVDVTFKMLSAA
jgi:hypothetical protein